jgi:filamentous hemagglutinin
VSKLPDVRNLLDKQGDMMNAASAAGEAVATQIGAIADAKRDAAKKAAEQAAIDGTNAARIAWRCIRRAVR